VTTPDDRSSLAAPAMRFGDFVAVDAVAVHVEPGEFFGFRGPVDGCRGLLGWIAARNAAQAVSSWWPGRSAG
jgi:hypothetical protein